jgi:hypothetical protein
MHYMEEDLENFDKWVAMQVVICMEAISFWLASEDLL